MTNKQKILFLCTGNSCRSQMAEGWTNKLYSNMFEAYSAGVKKSSLNPYAVKVMKESFVDIKDHKSKHVNELSNINFDYVITVCDNAKETCPVFNGECKVLHKSFDDPPALTKDIENEEEKLKVYRRVRDEIYQFIKSLPKFLDKN